MLRRPGQTEAITVKNPCYPERRWSAARNADPVTGNRPRTMNATVAPRAPRGGSPRLKGRAGEASTWTPRRASRTPKKCAGQPAPFLEVLRCIKPRIDLNVDVLGALRMLTRRIGLEPVVPQHPAPGRALLRPSRARRRMKKARASFPQLGNNLWTKVHPLGNNGPCSVRRAGPLASSGSSSERKAPWAL